MLMNLILLGPPGIGKGTQGDILSERLGIPKISAGQMMREEAKRNTPLGKMIKAHIDHGELVPDRTTMEMMDKRLRRPDCARGFILDGFPRTLAQAEALGKITRIDVVLNLAASGEEIMERISGRLTCRKCGEIYHKKFAKPKKGGVCDKCMGELYVREDQEADVVRRRFQVYEKETRPLIEYYKRKGILKNVKAEGSIEDVAKLVGKAVDDFMKVTKAA
jgi:adenylate kinase